MQELIEKLGIEWQSLLFQVINFLILLYVLHRFVYKPLIVVLEKRRKQVDESVKKAEAIDRELEEAQSKHQDILNEARVEAQGIRETASKDADGIRTKKIEETRQEIQGLLDKARAQINEEKNQALSEVRKEAAGLIILASEKVLRARLDTEHDKELVDRSVRELTK